jgi:hypothetical protein
LGPIESGNSRMRRSRAAILLAPPRLCEIVAAFFSGKNDVPHPHAQRCLFLGACLRISAGKGFNSGFFCATHLRLLSAGYSLDFNASEGMLLGDYFMPAIQSHNSFRSSSSIASFRMQIDRVPQASFRLLHAAGDASIAGEVERDHGTSGCIACARNRMAFAFSRPSVRLGA